MDRQEVISSNLRSVGYDESSRTLEVEFQSGSVYQYSNVPAKEYYKLMAAESHGKYFHANIRNDYNFRRVK